MKNLLLCLACSVLSLPAREFTVLTYNVENLFDLDGMAAYDDYQPPSTPTALGWQAERLVTKVNNIVRLLRQFNEGNGPEVILLQEIERDQTPATTVDWSDEGWMNFVEKFAQPDLAAMLDDPRFAPELRGWPAEAFLAKALLDAGLPPYRIILPPASSSPGNRQPVVQNVVFSRFPFTKISAHPVQEARDILEVWLEIDGQPLIIFNNHWKSGASNPQMEAIRRQNAAVLRRRLDALSQENPPPAILVAGDFNSHHDQRLLLPDGTPTAINDILLSGDNETALRHPTSILYNLWYELPPGQRRSDTYRGTWGTLMQMIVNAGCYDGQGVDYVDNSFFVACFPGLNADPLLHLPLRWYFYGPGSGFSDHFPIGAKFTVVPSPSTTAQPPASTAEKSTLLAVDYTIPKKSRVTHLKQLQNLSDAHFAAHLGHVVLVHEHLQKKNLKINDQEKTVYYVALKNRLLELYTYDPSLTELIARHDLRKKVKFYALLGEHQGRLQLEIPIPAWWGL